MSYIYIYDISSLRVKASAWNFLKIFISKVLFF